MDEESRVVYLEDVEDKHMPSSQGATSEGTTPQSSQATPTTKLTATKRQRTLMDMYTGPTKDTSEPANKKAKVALKAAVPSAKLMVKATSTSLKTSSVQRLNSIPFSLSAFISSIPDEHRELLKLECECMGKSWLKLLKDEIKKPYFIALKKFLWDEGVRGPEDNLRTLQVYPQPKDVYSWSNTPLGKVKVVILGQDPYHGPNQAHGLCFSVPKGVAVPPSLKNIYAEINSEYPEFEPPNHGNLSRWAESGVLMLNTCLTVKARTPGSHQKKGWEEFTDKVVDVVDRYGGANLGGGGSELSGIGRGVVFLAWGSWAAQRVAKLSKTKHLILTSAHPSPLSAHKGFLGNGHFKAANYWLEDKYGSSGKVDWCQL